jgi:threonine dehydrogenase-like Zn-dependent dehydrogenase
MKGKAAVLVGVGGPFEIREYPLPELEPGAILAKISMTSICGSDIHIYKGDRAAFIASKENPKLFGHEAVGTVYRLGSEVKTDYMGNPLKEGDRITWCFFNPCGHCWHCLNGLALCPNRHRFRTSPDEFPHFSATYAEYFYIRPGQWVYKVPDELSDGAVAPVNCALSTVTYALGQVGIGFSGSVVVQGAGGLGISAIAVSKDMGASQVIAVDKVEERLKVAKNFGADHVISLNQHQSAEERITKVMEITKGRGVDLVIELTGVPEGIPEGMQMLTPGGTYLVVGMISGKIAFKGELDATEFSFNGKKIWGSATYRPWVIPKVLDFMVRTKTKYPFDTLISDTFALEDIEKGMKLAAEGKVIRAAIIP